MFEMNEKDCIPNVVLVRMWVPVEMATLATIMLVLCTFQYANTRTDTQQFTQTRRHTDTPNQCSTGLQFRCNRICAQKLFDFQSQNVYQTFKTPAMAWLLNNTQQNNKIYQLVANSLKPVKYGKY